MEAAVKETGTCDDVLLLLGTKLTGKYSHPVFLPSQRSGLNSSASGPHISFR